MSGYRENRRVDPIPKQAAVTKNEAAQGTDVRLERTWVSVREGLADERRRAAGGGPKRSFAELLKKSK